MATTTSERTNTSAVQGLKLPRIEHPALHRSTVEGSSLALKGSRLANNRRGQYCSLPYNVSATGPSTYECSFEHSTKKFLFDQSNMNFLSPETQCSKLNQIHLFVLKAL